MFGSNLPIPMGSWWKAAGCAGLRVIEELDFCHPFLWLDYILGNNFDPLRWANRNQFLGFVSLFHFMTMVCKRFFVFVL